MNKIRKEITNNQWNRIKHFFPDRTGEKGRPPKNHRMMVNAILWILRTGAPWRDLPPCYGPWKSVYSRFRRWSKARLWDEIFTHISKNNNNDLNMIDSTAVKAHQHSSGGKGGKKQAIGKSRGGLTTKIHVVSDGDGLPLKVDLTGGNVHDSVPAVDLLKNIKSDFLLGDKGYDSSRIINFIKRQGSKAIIPSRKSNKIIRNYDKNKYKSRNLIECFLVKLNISGELQLVMKN